MTALTPHSFDSALLVSYVLEPALRSLALGGAVWLLLKVFRVRDVSFRLAAWTAVLYAALAMPLLGQVLPQLPVLVPVEPAAQPVASHSSTMRFATLNHEAVPAVLVSDVAPSLRPVARPVPSEEEATRIIPAAATTIASQPITIPWPLLLVGLYCLVAALLLGRFVLGLVLSRRLRRASRPVEDERLTLWLRSEALKAGLGKPPCIAESAALSVPVTLGVFRPVVLFPDGWNEWSETQMRAVLAHELSHVARHDAFTQMLSRIHRAVFWFSPLSWWLDRALVDLAEQASDDAALRAGTDRARYAEVLLQFFRALRTARGRVRWQAVSMAQGARSARRLERILSESRLSRRLGQTAVAAVVLLVVPLVGLAAAVQPTFSAGSQMPVVPTPPPPSPPAMAAVPAIPTAPPESEPLVPAEPARVPAVSKIPTLAATATPPALPAPSVTWFFGGPQVPVPVMAEVPPALPMLSLLLAQPPSLTTGTQTQGWYSDSKCGGNGAFAIVTGEKITVECGSVADLMRVRELSRQISGSFLWFRRNGRSYVIRDSATVRAALGALAPQKALAREEAELGREEAALGSRQTELGLRQAQVRVTVPDFSNEMRQMARAMRKLNFSDTRAEMAQAQRKLDAAIGSLDSSATQEELGRAQAQLAATLQAFDSSITQEQLRQVQEQLAAMQGRLASLQAMAGKQQAALARQQAAIGKQQAALARREAALGRREAELARKAAKIVRQLIDQAIASGLARPE
jgi:beta-lactamase regulating signal transducer with metallopeptidase domain